MRLVRSELNAGMDILCRYGVAIYFNLIISNDRTNLETDCSRWFAIFTNRSYSLSRTHDETLVLDSSALGLPRGRCSGVLSLIWHR